MARQEKIARTSGQRAKRRYLVCQELNKKGGKMPHIAKGGKYIFGWSIIKNDKSINLPKIVLQDYKISDKDKCILFTGSKTTVDFVYQQFH